MDTKRSFDWEFLKCMCLDFSLLCFIFHLIFFTSAVVVISICSKWISTYMYLSIQFSVLWWKKYIYECNEAWIVPLNWPYLGCVEMSVTIEIKNLYRVIRNEGELMHNYKFLSALTCVNCSTKQHLLRIKVIICLP